MSLVETRCRLCTEEIRTKYVGFNDLDLDRLKFKNKLRFLFKDLILEEDDTSSFLLCLFCVEKIRKTCEFREQCAAAYQFWGIHFGREPKKSFDLNYKIISTVDNHFTRYEFIPKNTQRKESETYIKMEESPINEIKSEIIEDPVPLVGNMKNKLNSLLKLSALRANENVESPESTAVLSLRLGRRKRTYTKTPLEEPETQKNIKIVNTTKKALDIKPILSIDKLKQNLNKRISIAGAVDIKSDPDDDDDVPLKTLKRKLNEIANKTAPIAIANPLDIPLKLNIFNLKNKLGTALKIGESLTEKQKKERRPKKHGLIVDYNQIIADKKNNIYYCKYCFKYFQNVQALRYHVVQHAKSRTKKLQKAAEKINTAEKEIKLPEKETKKTSQCDICQKWYVNVQLHKIRSHHKKNDKKD